MISRSAPQIYLQIAPDIIIASLNGSQQRHFRQSIRWLLDGNQLIFWIITSQILLKQYVKHHITALSTDKKKTAVKFSQTQLPQSLIVVGAKGFEPSASCSRSRRSTGLSHAPTLKSSQKKICYSRLKIQQMCTEARKNSVNNLIQFSKNNRFLKLENQST